MRAELKALDTPESPAGDLASFRPEDGAHFSLGVTATIGPAGADGGDLFDFTVCSPSWLAEQPLEKGFAFVRSTLVVERWDAALVERAIGDLCRRTSGPDWEHIATRLSRYGGWEFEDYTE